MYPRRKAGYPGLFYNAAFLTAACFAVGDFFAFSMQFHPAIAVPLMVGKLITGLVSLAIAIAISQGDQMEAVPEAALPTD
ncbi:ethanolamine utilization protein EutH [Pseudoramibacter sp. HA2172]|uniref:ethanolamine utilization protein EutH n=1 Tax=Pseudoramibacter faecis TaxID=3108534 RepID=UPI002E7918A5|nr:ethanolamine utilization protein EutH [Pseudoramibacter sp. HA2172]